jgi:hypothetical protein
MAEDATAGQGQRVGLLGLRTAEPDSTLKAGASRLRTQPATHADHPVAFV